MRIVDRQVFTLVMKYSTEIPKKAEGFFVLFFQMGDKVDSILSMLEKCHGLHPQHAREMSWTPSSACLRNAMDSILSMLEKCHGFHPQHAREMSWTPSSACCHGLHPQHAREMPWTPSSACLRNVMDSILSMLEKCHGLHPQHAREMPWA